MNPTKIRDHDLIGARVKLRVALENGNKDKFPKGHVMRIYQTWRGVFHLEDISPPFHGLRHIDRGCFDVVRLGNVGVRPQK